MVSGAPDPYKAHHHFVHFADYETNVRAEITLVIPVLLQLLEPRGRSNRVCVPRLPSPKQRQSRPGRGSGPGSATTTDGGARAAGRRPTNGDLTGLSRAGHSPAWSSSARCSWHT